MDELTRVCKTLLDNADVDISLNGETGVIRLNFTVGGSLEIIIFECSRFHSFKLVKDPEQAECLFVGETRVTEFTDQEQIDYWLASEGWGWSGGEKPQKLYRVELLGGVEVSIVCEEFGWKMLQ